MVDAALHPLAQSPTFTALIDPTPRIAPKVSLSPPVIVRPFDIEWDRQQIRQCARRLEVIGASCNAVETCIEKGAEFAALHEKLTKNKPNDKTRIGWKRAFERTENKFGMSRKYADGFIAIHKAFAHRGNMLPLSRLPQSIRPLVALAKLMVRNHDDEQPQDCLKVEQLEKWTTDELITPTTSEGEIKALAKEAGLLKPGKASKKSSTNPFDIAIKQASTEQLHAFARKNVKKLPLALPVEERTQLLKRLASPKPKRGKLEPIEDLCSLLNSALENQKAGKDSQALDCLGALNRKHADGDIDQLVLTGMKRRNATK
jgi:hypothetical protein